MDDALSFIYPDCMRLQSHGRLAPCVAHVVGYAAINDRMSERRMSGEEAQGFVIRDRRGRSEGDEPSSDTHATSADQPRAGGGKPGPEASADTGTGVPVSFSSFVFSLGTSALILMGEQLDPQLPQPPMNLSQAKEIIDILSILEEKTRGNLTAEEQAVLGDMLYALRMKFVDLASGKQATESR